MIRLVAFFEGIFGSIGDVFSWLLGLPDEDDYKGQLLNENSNIANIPVIYGERLVGGTRAFLSTGGNRDNQFLYMALTLSEGEIDSIGDIYVNDKVLTLQNVSGKTYQKNVAGDYKDIIWTQKFIGKNSQTSCATFFNDFGSGPDDIWGANHKLNGVAYLAIVVRYHEDKSMTSIPEVRCVVKGRKVYDPRNSTTAWSDNPALCLRDYLTNQRYGKGLPDSSIDDASFITAADFCDTTNTSHSGGLSINTFNINMILDTGKTLFKNTGRILTAMRGIMPYTEGKYSLLIDKQESSVGTINNDIVTRDISIKSTSKDKKLNQVKVTFVNPYKRWEQDNVIWPASGSYDEATFLAEDNQQVLSKEIDLDTVTSYYQARELARVAVLSSRATSIIVEVTCTSEALQYAVGDVITLEQESMGWTGAAAKDFRIMSMQLSPSGEVGLTLQEYDSAIYPWVVDVEQDEQPQTTLPNPSSVQPLPSNPVVTTNAEVMNDGTVQYYADLTWVAPDDALVNEYIVQINKKVGSITTENIETIKTRNTAAKYIITDSNAEYGVTVKAVNGSGSISDPKTAAPVAITLDTTAPADITGLSATGKLQQIELKWVNPTDADFDLVNVKVSDDENQPSEIYAQVRSNSYTHEVGSYSTTKYYWVAPVDTSGNVGSYTGPKNAITGSIDYSDVGNTPIIPEVATTAYLTLDDDDAPSVVEFNTAVGRDPINNDFVVVNKEFAFNYDDGAWVAVTEFIDGSLLVTGSLSASDITTGTLNANDVTISNLTIAGEQLPNNVAYIKDTKNIAVLINEDLVSSNVGEAILVGYTDGSIDRATDGFITYKGQKYDIQRGGGQRFVIMTTVANKSGYIVYDSAGTQKFDTGFGVEDNYNIGFVWFDGTNWRYDNNSAADGVIFTPAVTDLALGIMSTSSTDLIASAQLFFEVVKLTDAPEKGTTTNYGYLDFATTDEVSGIVSTYTNDQGYISSVNWDDVQSKPDDIVFDGDITDVVRTGEITDVVRTGEITDVVRDGDITDVVRQEQTQSNVLIDEDVRTLTVPYPVTEAEALEYTINSPSAVNEALIVLDILDAEGVTIPNGVQWSLNGVYQSQLNGPDNARIEYKFVVPLVSGNNSIKIWSAGQDGATVYSVKSYTFASNGGQWFRLSGRANTNAPSEADFKTAFGREPAPRDVILVESTTGATASYYFNKTTYAWDNAEAIVHGDLIVSESITALGEVTAGTFSLGNGAFTVNSSGQLSATGAIISGDITAGSINADNITFTGTLTADNLAGIPNVEALNMTQSMRNEIEEIIVTKFGSDASTGYYDEATGSFDAQDDNTEVCIISTFQHNGSNIDIDLTFSKSWQASSGDIPSVQVNIQRAPAGTTTWTTIKAQTITGNAFEEPELSVWFASIQGYVTITDNPDAGDYDYRFLTGNVSNLSLISLNARLEANETGEQIGTIDLADYARTDQDETISGNYTFTGDVEIVGDGDTFTLRSTDDITGHVGIQFTSQGESATQLGHIRYSHRDGNSYGNTESFTIGGTEATTAILADGNFLYRDGIYKKPATGTGAGTRKDTNWDTAYGWGNHATQSYATQSYVSTAISNLVDSAPETLDTLNELAAALGDDANFSATMTTALGNKANLAGATFTGDIKINGVTSNIARVSLNEGAVGNPDNVILEYDGTGSGDTNYFHIYSAVNGWMTKGSSFNIQPSTGKVDIGGTTFTEKFNVDGNVNFTGTITASGYNKSDWDTAYTYSQVGHLPLAGGTLTGNLTLNSATPEILFNGTSDAGVDMAIKATPEGLDFYEPEDVNKIHFQILDDTGVNAPFGYSVGATQVIDSSGNVKKSPTLTLSGDVSGTATFTDLGNATLTATVADDSHNHTHSDGDFTVNGSLIVPSNIVKFANLNDSITFEDDNNVFSFNTDNATGNAPVRAGSYQVGTTTVIDAGRNATFASLTTGSINSTGNIDTTGNIIISHGVSAPQSYHSLYIGGNGLSSGDKAIYIGNGGSGGDFGWELFYKGTGSGNDNQFIIRSENANNPVDAIKFDQNGATYFANTVNLPYIRLSSSIDASLTSTAHAFQIGSTAGQNLILDNNEVLSRNNGAVSELFLNGDGGGVKINGNNSSNVEILDGDITARGTSPRLMLRGSTTGTPYLAFYQNDVEKGYIQLLADSRVVYQSDNLHRFLANGSSHVANISASGVDAQSGGFLINGNEVIDSGRDATFAGLASSGTTAFTVNGITDLNAVPSAGSLTVVPFISEYQASNRSGSNYNGGIWIGARAGGYGSQFTVQANGANTPPFIRNLAGNSWGDWQKILTNLNPVESKTDSSHKWYSTTNAVGVTHEFSDLADTQAQKGYLKYFHANGASHGSGNAFTLTSTETDLSFAVDGKIIGTSFHVGFNAANSGTQIVDSARNAYFQSARLASGDNLEWGGAYSSGYPTIAASGSGASGGIGLYPTGNTDGEVARLNSSGFTVSGDIKASGDIIASGATPWVVIENTDETESGIIFNDLQAGTYPAASSQRFQMTWSASDNIFRMGHDNDTDQFTLTTAGNVSVTGNVTAYGSSSDARLKDNVKNIDDALNKVSKLNGVTFNYKGDDNQSTGLIAQDLLEVLPEVVYETEDEYYAVRYGNVVGLLVEAIKELKNEIEELKNGNNTN